MTEYVTVKDLPTAVRAALDAVEYHRADVAVETREAVILRGAGSAGRQAYAALVNLTTGQHTVTWGSWGGQNMFNPENAVDVDGRAYPLPANGVAITGSRSSTYPTSATLHIPASMTDRMLPASREELPTEERDALYCHKSIKGGAYRKDELRRRHVRPETVDALVARGLLSRNKAGAVQITTAGKNAVGDYRGY